MPRLVVVPAPVFQTGFAPILGRALEVHLDVIVTIDDEWKNLIIEASDDYELVLKLKMYVIDAVSTACKTGVGIVCPAVVLHRNDVNLIWLVDNGSVSLLSMKEMVRRGELIYATTLEELEDVKLFRLQTYKPLEHEHRRFFDYQFENLELELYEALYGSSDLERWRRLTGFATLPGITRTVVEAVKRYVAELCVFGEYNVCPGIVLTAHENRVDVKILRMTTKAENYMTRIDLAGLLANR
jgi:hypothetical protein